MRKRKFMVVALACAAALVVAACGGDDDGGGTGASGDKDCTWVIGSMGALSGDYATLGAPIFEGVEYAVNEANEEGDLACNLEIQREDSQGSSDQAPGLVQRMVINEELVACICPYFSGETLVSGDAFTEAGILMTGTGTNDTIDEQGFETWFRAVASDGVQGPAAATYISEVLKPQRVAVVHDGQDYSKGLAESVLSELGSAAVGPFIINPDEKDYSAVIAKLSNENPDAVYYGGYNPQAGTLLRQLAESGLKVPFISDDGAKDPSFGEGAGDAATGAVVTCPCADPNKVDSAAEFVEGMKAEYGDDAPGTFAADMYDVTTFVVDALREMSADDSIEDVRAAIISYFDEAEGLEGVTKTYTWDDTGELQADPLEDIWIYEWNDEVGDFTSLGKAADLL
jgi:branched-chain amino acid transport system substrate-binding protein